jgi:hypothetical protein
MFERVTSGEGSMRVRLMSGWLSVSEISSIEYSTIVLWTKVTERKMPAVPGDSVGVVPVSLF